MQAIPTSTSRPTPAAHTRTRDLDTLAALDTEALGHLYAGGHIRDVGALAGRPRGRMLAIRGLDRGAVASALRGFAGARGFPWGGKSFAGSGETGTGVNRVHGLGRHQLFPFLTRVGPSVLDGAPCVVLDYDLPDNPAFIRAIHDEVREIDRGLYLGPAMWKTATGPALVLWFALDMLEQAAPFGDKGAGA